MLLRFNNLLGVVVKIFDPTSTLEAEAVGLVSLRLAWSTEQVPEQPGIHRDNLF